MENGNNISDFEQILKKIDDSFFDKKIQGTQIEIRTFLGKTSTHLVFQLHRKFFEAGKRFRNMNNPMELTKAMMPAFWTMPLSMIKKEELDVLLQTGFALFEGNKMYLVDVGAIKTFAKVLGVGGDCIDIPSIYRDEYLAFQLYLNACTNMHLIGMNNTVLACMKDTYRPIPQQTLLEVAKMGRFVSYSVDDKRSSMMISFPEIRKKLEEEFPIDHIEPAIIVRIGSKGETALTAQEAYIIKGGIIIGSGRITAKHTKNFSINLFIEEIEKEIFPKFRRFFASYQAKKRLVVLKTNVIKHMESRIKPCIGKNLFENEIVPMIEKLPAISTATEVLDATVEYLGGLEMAEYARTKAEESMIDFFRDLDEEAV